MHPKWCGEGAPIFVREYGPFLGHPETGIFVGRAFPIGLTPHPYITCGWPAIPCQAASPVALRLDTLTGKVAGAEGGLKIVPADGAVQVEQLPGHKQSGHSLTLACPSNSIKLH